MILLVNFYFMRIIHLGYIKLKGATTIWEHWDGVKEDGTLWNDSMNSTIITHMALSLSGYTVILLD